MIFNQSPFVRLVLWLQNSLVLASHSQEKVRRVSKFSSVSIVEQIRECSGVSYLHAL